MEVKEGNHMNRLKQNRAHDIACSHLESDNTGQYTEHWTEECKTLARNTGNTQTDDTRNGKIPRVGENIVEIHKINLNKGRKCRLLFTKLPI